MFSKDLPQITSRFFCLGILKKFNLKTTKFDGEGFEIQN